MTIERYGNRAKFLETFNPSLQMTVAQHKERAIFGTAPTLGVVKAAYGENAPKLWLMPQIYDLCEFTNSKGKLDKAQVEWLASIIAQEYGFLKVTELLLFFYRFKTGRYGRFYGNVDPMIVLNALDEFKKERDAELSKKESEDYWQQQDAWKSEKRYSVQEFCQRNGMPIMSSMLEVMRYRDRVIGFVEYFCNFIKVLHEAQSRLQEKA